MKNLITIIILLCCSISVVAQDKTKEQVKPKAKDQVKEQNKKQEEEFDIVETALNLAKENDPKVDIEKYKKLIVELSVKLKKKLESVKGAEDTVKAVNQFFFFEEKFQLDKTDPQCLNPENLFLPGVIDRRKGYCISLSLVYLAITQKLKLPFYGITMPRHFIVRYDDGKTTINVEATNKGAKYSDENYMRRMRIPVEKKDQIFKKASNKDVLASYLNNMGGIATSQKKYEKAIGYYKTMLEYVDYNPTYHYNYGNVLFRTGKFQKAYDCYTKTLKIAPEYIDAVNNRALSLINLKKYDEAIADYDRGIEILKDQKAYKWHYNKAKTYNVQKKYKEAIEAYEKCFEEKGVYGKEARLRTAECYDALGEELRTFVKENAQQFVQPRL